MGSMFPVALFLGSLTVTVPPSIVTVQGDLSQLVRGNSPVQLVLEDSSLEVALEILAGIGDFELQLSPGVGDASPLTGTFEDDLENVLRSVLDAADVSHRIVGRTLIVGPPPGVITPLGFPRCGANTYYPC